jgi:hypothetical protein
MITHLNLYLRVKLIHKEYHKNQYLVHPLEFCYQRKVFVPKEGCFLNLESYV